jgi:hypothetical protein
MEDSVWMNGINADMGGRAVDEGAERVIASKIVPMRKPACTLQKTT